MNSSLGSSNQNPSRKISGKIPDSRQPSPPRQHQKPIFIRNKHGSQPSIPKRIERGQAMSACRLNKNLSQNETKQKILPNLTN